MFITNLTPCLTQEMDNIRMQNYLTPSLTIIYGHKLQLSPTTNYIIILMILIIDLYVKIQSTRNLNERVQDSFI